MDQSLRTVATQLLNVTSPGDVIKVGTKELIKAEHVIATTQKSTEKSDESLIREVNSEISNLESMGVSFGRPINSKFAYFETSHPGHAMALTEEELEREMSTTRLMTAYKNPTTTGGISTWILLNPPSTTVKSAEIEKKTKLPFQTEVKLTVKPNSSIDKVDTITQPEKVTEKMTPLTSVVTTERVTATTKRPITTTLKKIATTVRPEKITQSSEKVDLASSTTPKATHITTASSSSTTQRDDAISSISVPPTTKKNQAPRTTSKQKVTTPRTTSHTKSSRPGQQNRQKSTPTRRTTTARPETIKNETASTGKIEKVTFKPVQMITTTKNRPENTERPMFVTKIKASVLMDTQKNPTTLPPAPIVTTLSAASTLRSNLSGADLVEVPVRSKPIGTNKVSNAQLKAQPKRPVDENTQIEIEPIKVNAPILKIEKVNKGDSDEVVEKDTDDLSNSRIDLKFDFNPELTKINVETKAASASTATTTTKRPRHNSKRKKNKVRRRKPSRRTTSVAPSSTTLATTASSSMEIGDSDGVTTTDANVQVDNAVQESKIAPESKVPATATKLKKKQPPKTISTQIYNFLSREVMPNFGMMSLVGLGLGLASYFLYPFGGTITRRNYEVEPNYKTYSPHEYGSNYGQREEEVLSKVLQGMTNHENRYPAVKDYSGNNYYHYQHYDGAYDVPTTKKVDPRYPSPSASTSPGGLYRPAENTQPAVKYRNTEYRYAEAQTTPVYYDHKHADLTDLTGSANRQFVVGNVPKEYPPYETATFQPVVSKNGNGYESATESGQTQFERDIAQSFNFPPNPAGVHGYGQLEASTVRPDDGYEEIEITPTAVAVEHGPRSLKVKREAPTTDGRHSRPKRESVIQVIPSKRELEEEEKEEDLSNEILDIIDLALPGGEEKRRTKNASENNNEVEDLEAQKRKQQEEANTRVKEFIMRSTVTTARNAQGASSPSAESAESASKATEKIANDDSTVPLPSNNSDASTVEWFDGSTQRPAEGFSLINFMKKVAEIKFRLGLTILKHASEGFARYLGHVQKRINGEE